MEVAVPKCLAVGNIYLHFLFVPRTFVGFLGDSVGSVGVFSGLSRLAPGWVELPPRAAEQCLGPLRCGVRGCDRIQDGDSKVVFFFGRFSWGEFLSTSFWWRWNTPTREGNKHFSRWWQLKYFWNFHPDPWEVQPPTSNSCKRSYVAPKNGLKIGVADPYKWS